MPAIITRELINSALLSNNPTLQTTEEVFFLGGMDQWHHHPRYPFPSTGPMQHHPDNMHPYGYERQHDILRQYRLTRADLIDLQAKITAALAITP